MNWSDAALALGASGKIRGMEKLSTIERAQQAIVRAQSAVTRCRPALDWAKDIRAQKRVEHQGLRAEAEENMVRTEILKTGSA